MLEQPWIENIFLKVLNMSLTASLVILVILLVRLLLKRMPKIFSYVLWIVVLFRLLCPVSFSSTFSIFRTVPELSVEQGQIEYIPEDIAYVAEPKISLPIPAVGDMISATINETLPQGREALAADPLEIVITFGTLIWLGGIGIFLIYSVVTLVNLRQKLRTAVKEDKQVYITDRIDTPFVYGLFCPRIYLPSMLKKQEKEYILLHERIHIKRGDHIMKIIAFLTLCIHWFNPLVWLAFFLSGKDMEMSCDEAVIRIIGDEVKKEYSTSLLILSSGKRIVNGIPLAFGEGETGGRIKNILRYKKPAVIVSIIAIVICIAVVFALLANPKTDSSDEMQGNTLGENMSERITSVYGVIMDIYMVEKVEKGEALTSKRIIRIPGMGDFNIPEAKEIYPYFETENFELEPGDIVQITFPNDALYDKNGNYIGVEILETYPGQFGTPVESIVAMGRNHYLDITDSGTYLLSIPVAYVADAAQGDILEIYHEASGDSGEQEELLLNCALQEKEHVDGGIVVIGAEMSREEVEAYLREFGFGLRYEVVKSAEIQ